MVLIWSDNPHALEIQEEGEIYMVLEGKAFQYLLNTNYVLKSRLNENEEYLMVRKLLSNDCFVVFSPQVKYSQQAHHDYTFELNSENIN